MGERGGGAGMPSKGHRAGSPPKEGLFGRLLAEAEARMSGPGGPQDIWGQPHMLTAITEALKRPSSGSLYKQVGPSPLCPVTSTRERAFQRWVGGSFLGRHPLCLSRKLGGRRLRGRRQRMGGLITFPSSHLYHKGACCT